jgi:hypothetical protein
MSGTYPREQIDKHLDSSSKELSRLTEYISFGILIANFSKHESIYPPLLFISCFLSSSVLILHFKQYKGIYERSDNARENQKDNQSISVDYSVERRLFRSKTRMLYISIVMFGIIACNIFCPQFWHKILTCIFF